MLEGELEYEVDSILDHQVDKDKGETHFKHLVHWRGSGSDHDSWEPDVNLKNAPQIVQSYWDGLKAKGLEVHRPYATADNRTDSMIVGIGAAHSGIGAAHAGSPVVYYMGGVRQSVSQSSRDTRPETDQQY